MNMDKDIIVYLTIRPRSRVAILASMLFEVPSSQRSNDETNW